MAETFKARRINSATTTALGAIPRLLGRINIHALGAAATFEIFDSNDGTGTSLGKFTQGAAANTQPMTMHYDFWTDTGLSIVTTGTVDLTVSYR